MVPSSRYCNWWSYTCRKRSQNSTKTGDHLTMWHNTTPSPGVRFCLVIPVDSDIKLTFKPLVLSELFRAAQKARFQTLLSELEKLPPAQRNPSAKPKFVTNFAGCCPACPAGGVRNNRATLVTTASYVPHISNPTVNGGPHRSNSLHRMR